MDRRKEQGTTRRRFLKAWTASAGVLAFSRSGLGSQTASAMVDARIEVLPSEPIGIIAPELYGHFIEHLGGVIYDGVWVGEGSKIANTGGIRTKFVEAMRAVKAPVLRWPGGCFADSYDWRDGIGPRAKRPQRTGFWSQEETNGYGLHEFMRTCREIGTEPYLAADMRSLPARDFYQLVEYCNAPAGKIGEYGENALAGERGANGDVAPFNVRFWGVGNETWGCGGAQTAEEYGGEYRRYTEWVPRYGAAGSMGQDLRFIACGANGDDAAWAGGVMRSIGGHHQPYGMSTHYYVSGDAKKFAAGDALRYSDAEFYDVLARAAYMEDVILHSWSAMGATDRGHKTKIVMDEWGAWYGKGTELTPHYNLSQQSTMRDALLSGITFDIFQKHADKVAMANVAQTINCIQSLMLAEGDQFCVTPVFHVFRMYLPHRGAQSVRVEFAAAGIPNGLAQVSPVGGASGVGSIPPSSRLAGLSGSASIMGKAMTLTVVNPHLTEALTAEINVAGALVASVQGTVLAEKDVHAHNDFAHPDAVKPRGAVVKEPSGGRLMHSFPAASVTCLQVTLA